MNPALIDMLATMLLAQHLDPDNPTTSFTFTGTDYNNVVARLNGRGIAIHMNLDGEPPTITASFIHRPTMTNDELNARLASMPYWLRETLAQAMADAGDIG